jgi:CDP-diacylglycerol--glycerol-3-phosphate 3-phosphatidyltransferase
MTTSSLDRPAMAPLPLPLPVGRFDTWPNLVTLLRTTIAVALGGYAIATHDLRISALAYAVYWVGDILDGWLARRLDQETRLGAVLDIVSDRACTALLCAGLLAHLPGAWVLAVAFLLSFAVLDTMLSLAFLCWPILGPNDFHLVDPVVWRLNWSPLAKAANTAGVVVAIALGWYAVGLLVVVAVGAVKVWSAARVLRMLP